MYRNIVCAAAALILLLMGSVSAEPRAMTTEDAVIGGIAPGNDLGYPNTYAEDEIPSDEEVEAMIEAQIEEGSAWAIKSAKAR